MGFINLVFIYIFGGVTFLPVLLCLILLHAYITLPKYSTSPPLIHSSSDSLRDSSDDGHNLKSEKAINGLSEKFQRGYEPDVAAGYFAVCREYVPGGINGKPPERTTPAGATIAMESPSVYQSMYRSIFDRRQTPSLDPGKINGRTMKRARNVFFVVLRHGHLMLYDDSEQLEVRHVIALEHHNVSIYGGGEEIPEGELWIKRNAICLSRKSTIDYRVSSSKPFYLFSENCSDKEDFYFALLQNQESKSYASNNPPRPQQYSVKHIIGLVQKLHSSEEQLQTRWINALIGRGFLALYKTQEVEDFVRKKITKKISRVKKPAFLSGIILQRVDMGESAPYITNPRLKDLTIDGDCCAEADIKYSGNFRLEIAATARIDLGSRFKVREVNIVLAVVIKKLEGHSLIKFKPPPSNRVWFSFETMPDMEMTIEPIVSSRQITYNIILRAIESRIREVVAETVVLPHWDDIPFTDTQNQEFRGGIWSSIHSSPNSSQQTNVLDEDSEDKEEGDIDTIFLAPSSPRSKDDRTMSMPNALDATTIISSSPKETTSIHVSAEPGNDGASTSVNKSDRPPKAMRSRSFASAANPLVSLDSVNVDSIKYSKAKRHQDATSAMMAISSRSQPNSPTETPVGSPPEPPTLWENSITGSSSASSKASSALEQSAVPISTNEASLPTTPTSLSSRSAITANGTAARNGELQSDNRSLDKKQTMVALGAATAAAKKWGLGVLGRNNEQKISLNQRTNSEKTGTPERPLGRGRPLPPPGQPLPFPERPSSKVSQNSLISKTSSPTPEFPKRQQAEIKARPVPAHPFAARRGQRSRSGSSTGDGRIMVVEAPAESEPPSPINDIGKEHSSHPPTDSDDGKATSSAYQRAIALKIDDLNTITKRPNSIQISKSHEDDDSPLSSWQSAQEEDSRSRSIWMENNEHS